MTTLLGYVHTYGLFLLSFLYVSYISAGVVRRIRTPSAQTAQNRQKQDPKGRRLQLHLEVPNLRRFGLYHHMDIIKMNTRKGTTVVSRMMTIFRLMFVLFVLYLPMSSATDMTCAAGDASCQPEADEEVVHGQFSATIENDSNYRVDVYWDDGRFGTLMGTVERGGKMVLNLFSKHVLFVTRHGVRENLYVNDEPIQFSCKGPTVFRIPKTAAPSNDRCQDRYNICQTEARRGSCTSTPGWMIVNCCKACDPYISSSKLIDVDVRCSQEHLNMTGPVWKPGDLNKLFEEW